MSEVVPDFASTSFKFDETFPFKLQKFLFPPSSNAADGFKQLNGSFLIFSQDNVF